MNNGFRTGLLTGLILGAAVASTVALLARPRSAPPPRVDSNHPLEAGRLPPPPPPPAGPASAPPVQAEPSAAVAPAPASDGLQVRFAGMLEKGLGAFQSPDFGKLVQDFKASGKEGLDLLLNALRTSTSATERFLAAAILEGVGDPTAIPALAEVLKADADALVRRMASHAIAVLGAPEGEAPLRAASTGDVDWGVRVNSAYGLAKLKHEDGLRQLQLAYESPDTPPEYRIPILGGLADVAAPSTASLFRRILEESKDMSYLLMSIGALSKMKDAAAIPSLERLAASDQPEMVKQAAVKAVAAIRQ